MVKKIISIISIIILVISLAFITLLIMIMQLKEKDNCVDDINGKELTKDVIRLQPEITSQMKKQGVSESYMPFILALVNQESGGKGNDPFQASESKCGKIGCINNVAESVEHGIKTFKNKIKYIEKKGLNASMEIIAQSYNFGNGYIDYVISIGKKEYSLESAKAYSKKMCGTAGTSPATAVNEDKSACYGDYKYVLHVQQYMSIKCEVEESVGNLSNIGLSRITKGTVTAITWYYPNGGGWHPGIDIGNGVGTPVKAPSNSYVLLALESGRGYGKHIVLLTEAKGQTYVIILGHFSSLKVSQGDNVKNQSLIALMGNTGNSTGPHTHMEIIKLNMSTEKALQKYKSTGDYYFGIGYDSAGDCNKVCRLEPHKVYGVKMNGQY